MPREAPVTSAILLVRFVTDFPFYSAVYDGRKV
jgi:hypothetical protein